VVIANIILRIALLAALLLAAFPCRWCAARVMSRKADVRVDLHVGALTDVRMKAAVCMNLSCLGANLAACCIF